MFTLQEMVDAITDCAGEQWLEENLVFVSPLGERFSVQEFSMIYPQEGNNRIECKLTPLKVATVTIQATPPPPVQTKSMGD